MNDGAARASGLIVEAHRHHREGRLAEAETGYLEALRLQPKSPDALHYLGVLRHQQGDYGSAVKLISRAIKAVPGQAEMHLNLGSAYHKLGDPNQAVFAFRKAITLKPDEADAHFNLGHALRDIGDFKGAVAAYSTYLKLRPDDPSGHLGLGRAHADAGRFLEAMTEYDLAIRLDPEFAEAYDSTGNLLRDHGRFRTSSPFFEKAVEFAPQIPEWRFDLALALFRMEKLAEGWAYYDARHDRDAIRIVRRGTPPPYWNGEDLAGKSILVWMEQGLGDQILFASMLPDALKRAERCIVECAPRLAPVFARSFPEAHIVGNENLSIAKAETDNIDYQIAGGGLGRWLRPDIAHFPRQGAYLQADPDKVRVLRGRYEKLAQGRRIVGVSWRTTNAPENADKSLDLLQLGPVLQTSNVTFINLQYGDCRADLATVRKELGVKIMQDPDVDPLKDMDAFFAQVAAMDLVVTSSNTTAHVAGAIGKPVWVMLPPSKGLLWYWFLGRKDSPWYSSARLLRPTMPATGDTWWTEVVGEAARDLRAWVGAE